jgi:hypothetical protein
VVAPGLVGQPSGNTNKPGPTDWQGRDDWSVGPTSVTMWACMEEEVMRLEHVGNVVAAALAAAAVSAPPAYARWPSPEGASPQNAASAQQRQPEGSTDWELIGGE